ncbi:MAG TPA: hypothetical protein VJ792_05635 [Candidatus Nitrosotalea sp.]|nr:hypothetical protein [Candidatus Nitrosotalea sp.]
MKITSLAIIALLLVGVAPALGSYDYPSKQEQDLFGQLLGEFEKTDVPKKDVTDVVQTFGKPLIISFPCRPNDTNSFVVAVITTRLASFDDTTVHEDQVIGGTYTWNCLVTTEAGKVTLQCNNELRLNSKVLLNSTGVDPGIHKVENEVVLYHEFLHGQLMIDAMKNPGPWRNEICSRTPGEQVDYSYADPDHLEINPLQSKFASELMEEQGGEVITKYLLPNETRNGTFDTTVFRVGDYPQFADGGEVTLRAVNIENAKFGAADSTVFLNGTLANKTQPGLAWFYISGPNRTSSVANQSAVFEKRMAGLWANGLETDSDFHDVIQNLAGKSGTSSSESPIPHWLKTAAEWWFEGKIDDATFQQMVRYLVSEKIIS